MALQGRSQSRKRATSQVAQNRLSMGDFSQTYNYAQPPETSPQRMYSAGTNNSGLRANNNRQMGHHGEIRSSRGLG